MAEGYVPIGMYNSFEKQPKVSDRYERNQERYRDQRKLTELEWLEEIIRLVESATGPLEEWQKFYIVAAVSGRGVEWSQTRRGSHYHIMGLPCPICGRR